MWSNCVIIYDWFNSNLMGNKLEAETVGCWAISWREQSDKSWVIIHYESTSCTPTMLHIFFCQCWECSIKKKKKRKIQTEKIVLSREQAVCWETEQSDPDKHAGSENEICVGYLTVQGNLK